MPLVEVQPYLTVRLGSRCRSVFKTREFANYSPTVAALSYIYEYHRLIIYFHSWHDVYYLHESRLFAKEPSVYQSFVFLLHSYEEYGTPLILILHHHLSISHLNSMDPFLYQLTTKVV